LFRRNDNLCGYDTLLTLYYYVNDLVHLPNSTIKKLQQRMRAPFPPQKATAHPMSGGDRTWVLILRFWFSILTNCLPKMNLDTLTDPFHLRVACSPAACPDLNHLVLSLSYVATSHPANLPYPPLFFAPYLEPSPPYCSLLPVKRTSVTDLNGAHGRRFSVSLSTSDFSFFLSSLI